MKKKVKAPPKHHSHTTLEERARIAEKLKRGDSFRMIADDLGKSPSTISREVRNHSVVEPSKRNDCLHLKECTKKNVCGKTPCYVSKGCRNCKVPCKKHCEDYVQAFCEELSKPPYVCNGCQRVYTCPYEKRIYRPTVAEEKYRSTLKERRNGFDLTCEQIMAIDKLVSPLILKGQSPYHIKQTLGDALPVSESTLRRMIKNCELDARDIDLRSVVNRKPRRKNNHKLHRETVSLLKIGRTYKDYLSYLENHDVAVVQMDCVEGKKEDSAVLLTLHFPAFTCSWHLSSMNTPQIA